MAEQETIHEPKDLIEAIPEAIVAGAGDIAGVEEASDVKPARAELERDEVGERLASWIPRTQLGRDVKSGKERDIKNVLEGRKKILEPEIVDSLVSLESALLLIGQAKGKFGGGKRRTWRQTQKKTKEGNVITFAALAAVGNKEGYVGIGYGRAKETLPAREKAIRRAKLNIIKVGRGCGHFDCTCGESHSIPHVVEGKAGSVRIKIIPAPQGTGLVAGDECKRILRLAGIKDVYTVTRGYVRTTFNLAKACIDALEKTTTMER